MVDFLGLSPCSGFPVRAEPPTALEYTAAETWVRESYHRYFREHGGVPQLITWNLERFVNRYVVGDPVLELVMEVLESDFRNPLSPRLVAKFKSMVRDGVPADQLLEALRQITPGGARKPDMLGISVPGPLNFDGVEVGTVKTAKETYDELHEKLDILRDVVVPQVKMRLPDVERKYAAGLRSFPRPTDFVARASAFRLAEWELVLPLPVRIGENSGAPPTADWICFHPTNTWAPGGATTTTGTDGLVLYHIHRASLPALPPRVRQQVEVEFRRWRVADGLQLELNPALVAAFQESQSLWTPEGRQFFAYFGIAALVVLVGWVAWELGIVSGGAALAKSGLSALAGTPEAVGPTVRAASQIARQTWPLATGATSLIPISR